VTALRIEVDDPRREDVRPLLERHAAFAFAQSPPEHCHVLDVDELLDPAVTFVSARRNGEVVAVGALKELDPGHGELKSMHTAESLRGHGVGRAILDHLLGVARGRGYRRVSLETGASDPFVPAQALYLRAGFTRCEPFGSYTSNPYSVCMTLVLD
jgi:putative acetyltransferase